MRMGLGGLARQVGGEAVLAAVDLAARPVGGGVERQARGALAELVAVVGGDAEDRQSGMGIGEGADAGEEEFRDLGVRHAALAGGLPFPRDQRKKIGAGGMQVG